MALWPSARSRAASEPAPPAALLAIGRRHHGQRVAAQPAQVRADNGHDRTGGHGGVGGRAAVRQRLDPRGRRQLVRRRDHPP